MKIAYSIEGMHCASCASKIEHTLNQIDGVKEAAVNLVTESATVDYNPDVVDFTTLQKAVAKVGYQLNAAHDIATQNTIQTFQIDGIMLQSIDIKETEKISELVWHQIDQLPCDIIEYNRSVLDNMTKGIFYDEIGWDK